MSKLVLIVEDDFDIREVLCELVEEEGYLAVSAANGQKALDHLRSNNRLPDLIFLDLMMPVMDGRMFLLKLKQDPRLGALTVVVCTADAERFEGNVAGFLKKPLDLIKVVEALEQYCPKTN